MHLCTAQLHLSIASIGTNAQHDANDYASAVDRGTGVCGMDIVVEY